MITAPDKIIFDFLQEHHVISLAACHDNTVWSASLFYTTTVSNSPVPCLFVLTEPSTQHGKLILQNPEISGTISGQPRVISNIRGIQLSGSMHLLHDDAALAAKAQYFHRFPQAKGLDAPVWQITLNHLKLTDNRLSFGKKYTWSYNNNHTA